MFQQLVHRLPDDRAIETKAHLRGAVLMIEAQYVDNHGNVLAGHRRLVSKDEYPGINATFKSEFEAKSGLSIPFDLFPADLESLRCPAAPQHFKDAVIFGIAAGEPEQPAVHPVLPEPFTDWHREAALPATPREVYRMAGVCIKHRCLHWEPGRTGAEGDGDCTLVQRVKEALPIATQGLPICHIRSTCRWYAQEGQSACQVCPGVVTDIGELPQDSESDRLVRFF